ncbi:hypothetical protein STRTUCAR8_01574 [Streptomyces turgidiscabies Car8]|uniref:Uncharacterized protein n=1 Tax=Streptomyces turgidiscabies (strain Car8) TaxID=698760 RepID=L7F575_STRT8|nr:hypothetical protein STRTUCAR8_01574 [Streptomyces turgidiscabies Car8]
MRVCSTGAGSALPRDPEQLTRAPGPGGGEGLVCQGPVDSRAWVTAVLLAWT